MFQITRLIIRDFLFGITIAGACYQYAGIDDQSAKRFKCLAESRQDLLVRPQVWRQVFGEFVG